MFAKTAVQMHSERVGLSKAHLNTGPRGHIGAKVTAHLQQCYFNKSIRPRALGN